MNTLFSLHSKIAIVTGGYGHLGASICKGLASAGATVIAAGPNQSKFEKAFSASEKENIKYKAVDILSDASIIKLYEEVFVEFGSIDILFNNAFTAKSTHPQNTTRQDLTISFDGLIASVSSCINKVLKYMPKNGKIINISSMYGIVSPDFNLYTHFPQYFNSAQYGASKAAIIQLTKYYANFLASENIRVNCITPGPFPSLEVQKEAGFIKELEQRVPLKRIGTPDEMMGAAILLASDASSYITGQNIIIDGGWTIK